MKDLSISLFTPLPEFSNDFCDELKLFFNVVSFHINEDAADGETLLHNFAHLGSKAHCSFTLCGETEECEFTLPPEEEGELIAKRICKRYCKHALYRLCSRLTGVRPPWGSLTGIRPTRLFRQKMEQEGDYAGAEAGMMDTYDLSREKASLVRRIVEVQDRLPQPRPGDVDVYISIPFCRTRCAYCSFPGEAIGKAGSVPAYLDRLFAEMQDGRKLMDEAGLALRALYIGGGTPTSLSEPDFARLIDETLRLFPNAAEYTVEAGRPDTITRGKLQTLKDAGIDRISINPQTMNDETLRAIGRCHTAEDTRNAFYLAREMGFDNINMDVIAALPGEGLPHFSLTMEAIKALKPDSLTVHTLAIKRSSRLNLERYPLPEDNTAAEMVRMAEKYAALLDMEPYYLYRQKHMAGLQQNVGYAAKGKACLYNVDVMEEILSVLAFGAGAISKLVPPEKNSLIERAANVSDVRTYLERSNEMSARKRLLFLKGSEG